MEIKHDNFYSRLVATTSYQSGEVVRILEGTIVKSPTRTSIEIDTNKHIEDEYGIYMNHSFTPTCIIHNGSVVACQAIQPGDELTFNYNESETSMSHPFIDADTGKSVHGHSAHTQ